MKPINEYPTQPMDESTTQVFFGMLLSARGKDEQLEEAIAGDFISKVITARLPWAGAPSFTPQLTAFISVLAEGNPGRALMLAHACVMNNVTCILGLADLFPMGFPTEESYNTCWDAQKQDGVNGVDIQSNWAVQAENVA